MSRAQTVVLLLTQDKLPAHTCLAHETIALPELLSLFLLLVTTQHVTCLAHKTIVPPKARRSDLPATAARVKPKPEESQASK